MSINKTVLALVLLGLITISFALSKPIITEISKPIVLKEQIQLNVKGGWTDQPITIDTVRMGPVGTAGTTRDVVIGTMLKGLTDDTLRIFATQSAAPRKQFLYTDTTTVAPVKMFGWRAELVESASVGYDAAAIGDANNDGVNEIYYARSTTSPYRVRRAYWTGSAWATETLAYHSSAIYTLAVGDPDRDGNKEIYYGSGTAIFRLAYNSGTLTWDTTRIYTALGTVYGIAIGDFDSYYTGDEIAIATYYGSFERLVWSGSAWVGTPIIAASVIGFHAVAIGDFIPENPGNEVALNNAYGYATYGNFFAFWGSDTLWDYANFLYGTWSTTAKGGVSISSFLDYRPYKQVTLTTASSTQIPVMFYKDYTGAGNTGWWVRTLPGTGSTSYGNCMAVGNIDKWRSTTKYATEEIALSGNTRVFCYEQRFQKTNDVTLSAIRFLTSPLVINDAATVQLKITNTGYGAQGTIPVYYYHPTLGLISETCFTNIAYQDTVLYNFTQAINLPDSTTIAVKCSLGLAGDEYVADDFGTANVKAYYAMSGTYTVGTVKTNYSTLTAALADWKGRVITGHVKFQLTDASYGSETYPMTCTIPAGYKSGSWTLTIKPTSGVWSVFSGATASSGVPLLDLKGVQRVTVDSIELSNTYLSGPAIRFIAGASYNTIQNCVLKSVNTTTGGAVSFSTGVGTGNNNNTVQNCDVTMGATYVAYGFHFSGTSGLPNTGNVIKKCNVYDWHSYGFYIAAYTTDLTITECNIYTATARTATSMYGIYLSASTILGATITRNNIGPFLTSGSNPTLRGIYGLYAPTTVPYTIANNFFVFDATTTHAGATITGIYESSTTNSLWDIYYNSIYIGGTDVTGGVSYGIYRGYQTNMNFENNIIFNNRINGTGTGKHYCFYASNILSGLVSDYNDFYAPNDSGYVGCWGTAYYSKTLTDWQSASAQDANSINLNPDFGSLSDAVNLHIQPSSINVDSRGIPIAITDDYDGDARSASHPDIGADEYLPNTPGSVTLTSPSNTSTNQPLSGQLAWQMPTLTSFFDVYLEAGNTNPTTIVSHLQTGTTYDYNLLPATTYYWKIVAFNDTTNLGDAQSSTSAIWSFTTATPPNAPTNLVLSNITDTGMDLTWTDNSFDEDSFIVYMSLDGSTYNWYASNAASDNTYSATGLNPNVHYYWRVTAYSNTSGESNFAANDTWTLAEIPGAVTFSDVGVYSMKICLTPGNNPASTEFVARAAFGVADTKYVNPTTGALVNAEVWGDYAAFGGASGKLVTGLLSNTSYTFAVKARNVGLVETNYGTGAAQATNPFRDVGVSAITIPDSIIGVGAITPRVTVINQGEISENITVIAEIAPPSNVATVGTGTSTQRYPFAMYYGYERSSALYMGHEIGFNGWINYLDWYIATLTSHADSSVKIYLKTTTDTIIAASPYWADMINGATLVYDATTTFTAGDWYRVAITPFNYTSGNLLVLVETNYGGGGGETSTAKAIRYTSTSANYRHAYWYADNTPPAGTGTRSYNRPNIRIVNVPAPIYADTVVVTGVGPATEGTAPANFNRSWTPPATGDYVFNAYTVLAEDFNPANDMMTRDLTVIYNNNVAVTDLRFSAPFSPIIIGDSISISMKIENLGFNTQTSIPVYYRSPDGTVSATWTGSLPLFDTTVYTFTQKYYVNTTGSVAVMCSTDLSTDQDNSNDTLTKDFNVMPTLSGTKNVGSSGDYTTITDALLAWKNSVITSNVTFILTDASYLSETYPLVCSIPVGYRGGDWTLTIKPATGPGDVSPLIEGSATSIFTFNGVQRVTIDGAASGSSKDLTISNTNTSGRTISLINGACFNTVKNCILKSVGTAASYANIYIYTGGNNNNTILNCDITAGATYTYAGIYMYGTSGNENTGNLIKQCNIYDWYYYGIYVSSYNGANTITECNIYTLNQRTGTTMYGIYISSSTSSFTITRNKIHDYWTSGASPTLRGIYISSASTESPTTIANNIIYLDATNTHTGIVNGIYTSTALCDIYYNSIYIGGGTDLLTTASYGYYRASSANPTNFKNNIIFDNRSSNGSTGKHYAVYASATGTNFASDYNDLYVTDPGGTSGQLLGYWSGGSPAYCTTLTQWRTVSAGDANSISANPNFVSTTDLHIQPTSQTVNRKATPIAGITYDIDNEVRNTTWPDIGADEYTPTQPGPLTLISPPDLSIDQPLDGQLVWNEATMTQFYTVYLDTISPPVIEISSFGTDTFYNYTDLTKEETYFWRVAALNDTNNVTDGGAIFSPIWSFTTINRDVGCTKIISPVGTVDSGTVIVPVCSVYNYGVITEEYLVRMKVGTLYNDTVRVTSHLAKTYKHITFPQFVALERGFNAVSCSTELDGDFDNTNDKQTGQFKVRGRDVRTVAILAPTGTILHGTTVQPRAQIKNEGTEVETLSVRFKIGTIYDSVVNVLTLLPDEQREVAFPDWIAVECSYVVSCSTELAVDMTPANDKMTGNIIVEKHDVGTLSITAPTGTVLHGTIVIPRARVKNFGMHTTETFDVMFKIGDIYTSTKSVTNLGPLAETTVTFDNWTAVECNYVTSCSTMLATDQNNTNNKVTDNITVQKHDVGTLSITAPTGTLLHGTLVTPRARVKNYGVHTTETFNVVFKIGGIYTNTKTVTSLGPLAETTVTFDNWTAVECNYVTSCSTMLATDQNNANNKVTDNITVQKHDVGALSIVAPTGTLLHGTVVTPRARVKNFGMHTTESFNVTFNIMGAGYTSTKPVTNLGPLAETTVIFDNWTAVECNYVTSCSTMLDTDQNNANNKVTGNITVQRHDVGPNQIITPVSTGTYYGGNIMYPSAKVKNFGVHTTESFNVTFNIMGAGYTSTNAVTNLSSLAETTLIFDPWLSEIGTYNTIIFTSLSEDQNLSNDTLYGEFTAATPATNVATIGILAPIDTILEGVPIAPRAIVINSGNIPATFAVRFKIGGVYSEVVNVTSLAPQAQTEVVFPAWTPYRCNYVVSCSTEYVLDQNGDDDKFTDIVTVQYYDVGVMTILVPFDTAVICNDYVPTVVVSNNGVHVTTQLCTVAVKIIRYPAMMDSFCHVASDLEHPVVVYDTFVVAEVNVGLNTVYLPIWHPYWSDIFWTHNPTYHTVYAEVSATNDMNSENNSLLNLLTVNGRANDLQTNWTGLLDGYRPLNQETLEIRTYNVASVVSNPVGPTAEFRSIVKIIQENNNAIVYTRYLDEQLAPKTYSCFSYQSGWTPTEPGWYRIYSWLEARPEIDMIAENNTWERRYYFVNLVSTIANGSTNQAIQGNIETPTTFALALARPNPFSAMTNIQWQLPVASDVSITVYDALGRAVKTLAKGSYQAGYHNINWNRTDDNNQRVSSGIYFYEMRTDKYTSRQKLVIK